MNALTNLAKPNAMTRLISPLQRLCCLAAVLLLASNVAGAADSGITGLSVDTVVPRLDVASSRLPANQTYQQSIANMLHLLTADWSFSAQDALGTIRVTNPAGDKIVILPVGGLQVDPDRQDGALCVGNGLCQTVANHIVTTFNATLDEPAAFVAAIRQYDPTATLRLNSEGNLLVSVSGHYYLIQVGWGVLSRAAVGNALASDGGTLWFSGSAGKQALYPVLANLDRLLAVARQLDATATARGDHQGKVVLVLNGKTFALTPGWEVIATPAAHAKDDGWLDNGVFYLNYLDGTAQALIVN